MQLITREANGPGGGRQLPHDKELSDARRAGIDLYMLALRRGDFVLALFDETRPLSTSEVHRRDPSSLGCRWMPRTSLRYVRSAQRR